MQLTPEQQSELSRAKAAGQKRVRLSMTSLQKEEWAAAAQRELEAQEENVERFRKIKAAAQQEGFLGDLRRAISGSRRPIHELAAEIGLEAQALSDFRAGEAELSAAALDRLIAALGLRLMQEIPR